VRPIDGHAHVGSWNLPEFAGRTNTVADASSIYSRYNWAGALLVPTDQAQSAPLALQAAQASGPVVFRTAFWADIDAPESPARFEESVSRFAALKLHPSCHRTAVTDPRWRPFCEVASKAGLPAVVHCGRWQEVAGFAHALELAAAFPSMPVILAHMGGDSPHLVTGAVDSVLQDKLDNVFFGTESIREPWLLEMAIARLGASRLVFGSDYNLNHPEMFRRLIEVLNITDKQREAIFRNNINGLVPTPLRFF
jgi:predicted TIM-barrel fold metal-dependent hydrolase